MPNVKPQKFTERALVALTPQQNRELGQLAKELGMSRAGVLRYGLQVLTQVAPHLRDAWQSTIEETMGDVIR